MGHGAVVAESDTRARGDARAVRIELVFVDHVVRTANAGVFGESGRIDRGGVGDRSGKVLLRRDRRRRTLRKRTAQFEGPRAAANDRGDVLLAGFFKGDWWAASQFAGLELPDERAGGRVVGLQGAVAGHLE